MIYCPEQDSNLGPTRLSQLEFQTWRIIPLGHPFNLVRHPAPKNKLFSYSEKNKFFCQKKCPRAGFELGTLTTELSTDTLDRSAR